MLRVFFTIVVPLVFPTLVYLLWMRASQPSQHGDTIRWAMLPWVWLVGAGALLLGLVLFLVAVNFGTAQPGAYVPPRWENGRIVPGHIAPGHGEGRPAR